MKKIFTSKPMTLVVQFCLYLITATVFYLAFTSDKIASASLSPMRIILFLVMLPLILKLLLQIALALLYRFKPGNGLVNNDSKPSVSVLLPAYNEEVGIIKTILSVLNSNYKNFELIVINDGSNDQTNSLVRQFIEQHESANNPAEIKYLSLKNGGKAKALNKGLKLATGEIVITVDADCIMDPEAINKFVQRFTNPHVGAVAGNVIVSNKKKPLEIIQQLEYVCGFFFKRADSIFNAVHIIGGAAAAYRKEVLLNLRGFDEELITEDVEMSMRILGHGYQTRYAHDAVIFTEGPSDWQGLCNQRLRWKYGRVLTYLKHKELFFSKNNQHSSYLSWLVLPLAIYSEILLLLQGLLLTIFYAYSIIGQDYLALALMIAFSSSLVSIQILIDSKAKFHHNLLLLTPIAWLLLYVIDLVELQALTRSLKRLFKRESLQWQKWQRVGIGQQG